MEALVARISVSLFLVCWAPLVIGLWWASSCAGPLCVCGVVRSGARAPCKRAPETLCRATGGTLWRLGQRFGVCVCVGSSEGSLQMRSVRFPPPHRSPERIRANSVGPARDLTVSSPRAQPKARVLITVQGLSGSLRSKVVADTFAPQSVLPSRAFPRHLLLPSLPADPLIRWPP